MPTPTRLPGVSIRVQLPESDAAPSISCYLARIISESAFDSGGQGYLHASWESALFGGHRLLLTAVSSESVSNWITTPAPVGPGRKGAPCRRVRRRLFPPPLAPGEGSPSACPFRALFSKIEQLSNPSRLHFCRHLVLRRPRIAAGVSPNVRQNIV